MNTTCSSNSNSCATETRQTVTPRYTVQGDASTTEIRVDLPGVAKEAVEVHLDKSILTIQAKRTPVSREGWRSLHQELNQQDYTLRLRVHSSVDETALQAKLEDGVLVLTLPVKEAAKPRAITVA